MKAIAHRLSRLKPTTFKLSYSPTYTSFLPNHIATNASHPLHIAQRRRQQDHKKEGLWWHATNGIDISKSSCVRHWARRRLKQAFVEELRARGYDETGKLVDKSKLQDKYVANVVRQGRSVDLSGSLRMHGVPPLVPAKYEAVKEEVRGIVDALVQIAVDAALGFVGEGERSGLGQRRPQIQRSQAAPAKAAAPKKKKDAEDELPRMKPTTPPRYSPRTRTASSAASRMKPKAVPARAAPRTKKSSTMSLAEDYCI